MRLPALPRDLSAKALATVEVLTKWGPYLIVVFLFFIFSFLIFKSPTFAQTVSIPNSNLPNYQNNQTNPYAAPNTNPDVPKNLHTYTQSVMIEVMSALVCQLSGIDPTNVSQKCLGVDPKTGSIGFVEGGGGAVGFMGGMIGMLYTAPVHAADYMKDLAQNFGIAKSTYAQNTGLGVSRVSPLIPLWSKFRDIVYLLFVLVFVIIGVAIMLRVKIDPRTVMTLQNQIPKLIIGILLVTFSLAIAAFLIDLMYVALYLILNIFEHDVPRLYTSPFSVAHDTFNIFTVAFNASYSVGNIIASLTPGLFTTYLGSIITAVLGFILAGPIGAVAGSTCAIFESLPVVGGFLSGALNFITSGFGLFGGGACDLTNYAGKIVIGGLAGIIAFLVILIAILWALFRLWFILLQAYIMILIDIVFAPFWIVAGLFPGRTISFTSWLRSLISNLAAFPATLVLFLLGETFMHLFDAGGGDMFVPPFIGNPNGERFGAIIALGIILTAPRIVTTLREALKAPKIDLSSIGAAVGAGAGYPISVAKGVGQTIAGYEEYRLAGYDQATGRVSYGKVGKLRAFGRRFGVG